MASPPPPSSGLPPSMGPGARPVQPGERPDGLLGEISDIRSHYNIHVTSDAIELGYELKGQQKHFRLPFDNIPVTGWTKSLCWQGTSGAMVSGTLLIDMIRACENITGRSLTQEEAEGMAYYGSRRMMTMYVGQGAAIGLGIGSAYWGRKEFKFPFMKPKPLERYDSFPMRVLPILKGQAARVMWQITRANVYTVMWLFITNPLFRSVADTRMTVGLYSDRRTHEITQAIKGKFDRLRSNRASQAADILRTGQPTQQKASPEDEASPTAFDDSQSYGGQSNYAGDGTFTDGNTDTGLIGDSAVQRQKTQQASPNSWSRAQSRGSRESFQQPGQDNPSDFFFDDASPTAGNDPDMGASQPYSNQRSGNAWSRLRKGENVGQSGSPRSAPNDRSSFQNQSPDFETKSDTFSFSKSEEERRLAKDQAQKEFDAMLDQERRESGSGDYARDMRAAEAGNEATSATDSAWGRRRRG